MHRRLVARIIGTGTCDLRPDLRSVKIRCPAPDRTASSASDRIRWIASRNPFAAPRSNVQSIAVHIVPEMPQPSPQILRSPKTGYPEQGSRSVRYSRPERCPNSRTAFLDDITRNSRKLSIGGFVTWLKNSDGKSGSMGGIYPTKPRDGVSSPIDAIASSFASSAIGCKITSKVFNCKTSSNLPLAQFTHPETVPSLSPTP